MLVLNVDAIQEAGTLAVSCLEKRSLSIPLGLLLLGDRLQKVINLNAKTLQKPSTLLLLTMLFQPKYRQPTHR